MLDDLDDDLALLPVGRPARERDKKEKKPLGDMTYREKYRQK